MSPPSRYAPLLCITDCPQRRKLSAAELACHRPVIGERQEQRAPRERPAAEDPVRLQVAQVERAEGGPQPATRPKQAQPRTEQQLRRNGAHVGGIAVSPRKERRVDVGREVEPRRKGDVRQLWAAVGQVAWVVSDLLAMRSGQVALVFRHRDRPLSDEAQVATERCAQLLLEAVDARAGQIHGARRTARAAQPVDEIVRQGAEDRGATEQRPPRTRAVDPEREVRVRPSLGKQAWVSDETFVSVAVELEERRCPLVATDVPLEGRALVQRTDQPEAIDGKRAKDGRDLAGPRCRWCRRPRRRRSSARRGPTE